MRRDEESKERQTVKPKAETANPGFRDPRASLTFVSDSAEVNKASRSTNKAHVDNDATVICDAAARGTTGLPPEQTSYRQPHSSYTAAEDARMRCEFDRQSDLYAPFTWALPDSYENVNTSHCETPWAL